MKTCGIFSVHYFQIRFEHWGEPIYLIPFGDIHRDSPLCHERKWKEFLKWAEGKERSYFLGMGDYNDLLSSSERRILANPDLHDSTVNTIDEILLDRTRKLYEEIKFMRGRMIGLLGGNHYGIFESGITTDQKLAELLKCPFLGVTSFIRFAMTKSYTSKHMCIDIWAHHGKGAARLSGGSLNTVEQMAEIAEADIFCVDDKTEILSVDGWKKQGEIKIGDPVYSWRDGRIMRDRALSVIDEPYNGEMVAIKNTSLSMCLSPNHRVYYRHRYQGRKGAWIVKKARLFIGGKAQIQIPVSGSVISSSKFLISKQWARLAGWIMSEGSFCSPGIRITQKSKEKTTDIVRTIEQCGLTATTQKRKDGINIVYIPSKYREEVQKTIALKDIPSWLMESPQEAFEQFLDSAMLGDGNWQKRGRNGTYYSSNLGLIDKFQIALTLHGYRSGISYKSGGFKNGCWVLTICKRQTVDVLLTASPAILISNMCARIWCVNTQNKTIICRRDGKVFVTGNCMGHDHKKPITFLDKLRLKGQGNSLRLRERKILLARTGAFLRGYVDGQKSYIVDAGMKPTSIGVVKIELTPRREHGPGNEEEVYIDIHAGI